MEGRQTAGWVLALAGSLVLHAAIIGFVAAPSLFSNGGDGDGEMVQAQPVAPEAPSAQDTPSKPSPPPSAGSAKPNPSRPKANPPATRPDAPPATGDEVRRPDFHVVRQGDTITKIAKDYGMTPEEIARINGKPLKRLNNIWVGQKIKLK